MISILAVSLVWPVMIAAPAEAVSPGDFIQIVSPPTNSLNIYTTSNPEVDFVVNYHYSDSSTKNTGLVTIALMISDNLGNKELNEVYQTGPETGTATFTVDFSQPVYSIGTDTPSYNVLAYVKEAGWDITSPSVGSGIILDLEPGQAAATPVQAVAPPVTTGNNNKSGGSPVGGIIGGIFGLGLIAVLINVIRTRIGGGNKPPQKTTVQTGGGNKTTPPLSPPRPQTNKDIADADDALSKAKKNAALFEKWTNIRDSVAGDPDLYGFVEKARNSIIGPNGEVNEANLNRLQFLLKNWIKRDKLGTQLPDYTSSDAFADSVQQASGNVLIRMGAAYLTGGYSEMALNPLSALSSMRGVIMQGGSTLKAVGLGFAQSGFELAIGESGRLLKFIPKGEAPLPEPAVPVTGEDQLAALAGKNKSLADELASLGQSGEQGGGQMTRDAFMKSTEVARAGETGAYELTDAERKLLQLNNNPEFRKVMADNSKLIPADIKETMGVAKQKVYQQARNDAINNVMDQMAEDGVQTGDKTFLLKQTGTHAQAGNPGWNSVKSDFDHTVDFGDAKYNQLYEQNFNSSLEGQGTSAQAIDANVYGEGTSSHGAYEDGAMKFVQHYNETSGSDVMIRNVKGATTISTETPQTSTSLLSRMNSDDVASAHSNYQTFFQKDVAKAGSDLNNQIVNGSKCVSRDAGQYSAQYVKTYQQTGTMGYEPPSAAKVADLIKKQGYSVDDAMSRVGYSGSKQQLFNDYKTIMGVK